MCRSPLTLFTPFGIHGDKMHSLDPYDGSDENGQHGGLSGKEWLRARFLSDAIPATSLAAWATYVDAGGEGVSGLQADVLVEEEVNTYDEQDRLRRTDYLDGTSATNHSSCCRLLWRRDREGRRVLRSAVTGEDHLYYAEEDAWIREIANGGHKTTQHFMDALGRETNTVVYVAQSEGEAVDWTASNQARAAGSAAVATAAYPLGTDDFVVRVDERGRTTTNETSYAQSAVTTVATVTTNDVFVLKTINVSTRGGGSTTRREWTAASGVPAGGPSSPTAAWTQTSRGTSYDQYGCRVETVMEFSHDAPYGTVTSTSTYDFLGRLVASSRPGMNSSTLVTTTTYDGATSRRISSATTGSLPTTFAYNALGEMCASTCDGVSYTSDVSYGEDSGGRILRMTATHRQVGTATPVQTGLTCEQLNCHAHGILYCTETSGEDGMTTTEIIYPDVFTLEVGNEEFEVAGRFTFRQTGNGTPEESFS